MELGNQDERKVELLGVGLWRDEVRFDPKRKEEILAPDFFEFGRSGRMCRREDIIDTPAQPITARLPLMGFRARLLESSLAQMTYVSAVTYHGVEELSSRRSIWSRIGNAWKLSFDQGTVIPG